MRGDEAFKEASIRAYLKEESGYVEFNRPWRIKGQLKKCVVFKHSEAPDDILSLIEGVTV